MLALLAVGFVGALSLLMCWHQRKRRRQQHELSAYPGSEALREASRFDSLLPPEGRARPGSDEAVPKRKPEAPGGTAVQAEEPERARDANKLGKVLEEREAVNRVFSGKLDPGSISWTLERSNAEIVEPVNASEAAEIQEISRKQRHQRSTRRRLEPQKRGGRSRVVRKPSSIYGGDFKPLKPKSSRPRAEVICRVRARQWIVGVQVVPEGSLDTADCIVYQNSLELTLDDSDDGLWRLNALSGELSVKARSFRHEADWQVHLGNDSMMLFKLTGAGRSEGYLVRNASSPGLYLAVVPQTWQRDDTEGDPAPLEPEPASIRGCVAHYFSLIRGGHGRVVFRTPQGGRVVIRQTTPLVELIGCKIEDAGEGIGPLFANHPPRLRPADGERWNEIETIVLGEEGSKKRRWRVDFRPDPNSIEQTLPSELAERRGGWYYLRFYDASADLVESLDFRFMSGLREIRIAMSSPFPSEDGHEPVLVEFVHEGDVLINLIDNTATTSIQIERGNNETVVVIPSVPDLDRTRWCLGYADGPTVDVSVLIERVWWGVASESDEQVAWQDKSIELSRRDIAASSTKALSILFPKPGWIERILVGFKKSDALVYRPGATQQRLTIPLRDFCGCQQLESPGVLLLNTWASIDHHRLSATLCKVAVRLACGKCDFKTESWEDMAKHVRDRHIDNYFRSLTYEEMRKRVPSLPLKIYCCPYCGYYVESNDLNSPTSAICRHIERDCPALTGSSVRKVNFRIITNIDEIREKVMNNLPYVHRCRLCNHDIEGADYGKDAFGHLWEKHSMEICTLE